MTDIKVTGPLPPEGGQWCAACVMLAKQRLHDERLDQMRDALSDGKQGTMTFPVPAGMLLEEAVTVALWGDSPNLAPMPLCWTHAAGVQLKPRSALEIANGAIPLPKGLIKGQG